LATSSQSRAVRNYRKRLGKRGMMRFEVLGLRKDRELVRGVARRLAEKTPEAEDIRASMHRLTSEETNGKRSLLEVLRSWPLAELNLKRPFVRGRKIDL
jgi:hypothetical protein